jgi:hypothetical protein
MGAYEYSPGDLDGDLDIGFNDHSLGAPCLCGPGVATTMNCEQADLDRDDGVDLADVAFLQVAR